MKMKMLLVKEVNKEPIVVQHGNQTHLIWTRPHTLML